MAKIYTKDSGLEFIITPKFEQKIGSKSVQKDEYLTGCYDSSTGGYWVKGMGFVRKEDVNRICLAEEFEEETEE